ncbi:hypothetical protein [Hyphomicrobium sulfonivorans]|uniref:hypothetical protein n=1 Tax=Hyphomicrobium sulfonivorans TaxID=121290 RepID=UPI00156F8EF1|nr:hypothetical protein [Hyphomicrobium sulfonivorans]MBI1650318.1 hypothetical protein [Hyphomicrobium sulfonivorans]NSL72319.1 hypothetical protein [Hyphomicrobium sulfonivorans]
MSYTSGKQEAIRPCRRDDVDALAGLFARSFRDGKGSGSTELRRYFEDVVFTGVGAGEEPRSRVFTDNTGEVRGFIGIWSRQMQLNGRPISAAVAGSMMVDQPELHPTAGARLLRSFLSGPQDLSFSETANGISQRMWQKVGGSQLSAGSLDWLRVVRPAGTAVAAAQHVFRPAGLMRPFASGFDMLLQRLDRNPLALPAAQDGVHDVEATAADIESLIPELSRTYTLYPDWHTPSLSMLLTHAEAKERYGVLQRRIVLDRSGKPVGCYLFYARRGQIARVLQVLALPEHVGTALDALFRRAQELGCVAIRGRADDVLLDALVARRCVLFHGASTLVHARDKELLREVRSGPALLTGLAGESWTRLVGGEFA